MNTPLVHLPRVVTVLFVAAMVCLQSCAQSKSAPLPSPSLDIPANDGKTQSVVFAGGCFWGIQAVFQHVKGVKKATSGYAGGTEKTADYEKVSSGDTDHAESVQVIYDPSQVSYGQLLKVFFSVAHDPTQLNRQGPDHGRQYRSAIFFSNAEQEKVTRAYVEQLQAGKIFSRPIVTEIVPLEAFYIAESYHQDYATRHPRDPYIVFNDAPKVANLKSQLPELYVAR